MRCDAVSLRDPVLCFSWWWASAVLSMCLQSSSETECAVFLRKVVVIYHHWYRCFSTNLRACVLSGYQIE